MELQAGFYASQLGKSRQMLRFGKSARGAYVRISFGVGGTVTLGEGSVTRGVRPRRFC